MLRRMFNEFPQAIFKCTHQKQVPRRDGSRRVAGVIQGIASLVESGANPQFRPGGGKSFEDCHALALWEMSSLYRVPITDLERNYEPLRFLF